MNAIARCDRHGGTVALGRMQWRGLLLLCAECAKDYDMSIEQEDAAVAKVSTHPRVTLDDIKANIIERHDINARDALLELTHIHDAPAVRDFRHPTAGLSICILVLRNGFTVVGTSAAASPENFNAEIGKQIAYDAAIRQVWPLMGYALRQQLNDMNTEHDSELRNARREPTSWERQRLTESNQPYSPEDRTA